MIYQIKITPLTKTQISNLGKGKGVRVRAGSFPIQVDKKQYTRFHKNANAGKAFTLKLSAKQGKGIFGDMLRFIKSKPLLKEAVNAGIRGSKKYAHKGIDFLSRKAHQKVDDFQTLGDGLRRPIKRRGRGLFGTVLSGAAGLSKLIGGPGSGEASQVLGTIGDISNALGFGMKPKKRVGPKRRATQAQLQALARGRAIRDANRLAKKGSGRARKHYYRGSALLPAGY